MFYFLESISLGCKFRKKESQRRTLPSSKLASVDRTTEQKRILLLDVLEKITLIFLPKKKRSFASQARHKRFGRIGFFSEK
ncbi:hypothetical protein CH376_05810 [Leptospira adleri]|uniref:Uncharacterized protein n=1 Tax=Leptospira adleri TaxID=2023186 RepID=A0ABX4P448_9LEPT|nr:hypothetical protein CH376_05810 [Leptospira adleri]